jgi:hypothetical protein
VCLGICGLVYGCVFLRSCELMLCRRCVLELHAIAAKKAEGGGNFAMAMTGKERERFLDSIGDDTGAYYHMLGTVNVESSDCSRPDDRDSIHTGI